jgi:hypothetical protein
MTPEAGIAAALAGDLCAWIDRAVPDTERAGSGSSARRRAA